MGALLHLRFPFVYVLAPIYVWGAYWAPGGWTARTTLGFLLVHLALYPGANAFNSAYDRDTGPIGGLARPPAVPRDLARGSVLLQGAGALLAPLVGVGFTVAYLALWAIFTAYSHPAFRWKHSPVLSTAAIVGGQGGLGWVLGWSAAGGGWRLGGTASGSLAAACVAVAALYPLTQVYQMAEDAAREDRTLASRLGVGGTFVWFAAGLVALAALLWPLGRPGFGLTALHVGAVGAAAAILRPAGWVPSHGWVMAVLYAGSTALLLYLVTTWR
ncbi:MAG TPA: UbiA family prenyltransferase [Gemmatimonadota bacterium]|nr:UbiA family prenyltransferase [Gemmatimonadota bacterium]